MGITYICFPVEVIVLLVHTYILFAIAQLATQFIYVFSSNNQSCRFLFSFKDTTLYIPSLHVCYVCRFIVFHADWHIEEKLTVQKKKNMSSGDIASLKNIIPTILVFHSIPHHLRAYWKGKFKQSKFNTKQIDRHDGDREHFLKHDEYDGIYICSNTHIQRCVLPLKEFE